MSNLAVTFDQAKLGNVFHAASQSVATLSALSTTATGLILVNPFGSGKNLAVMTITWAFSTAPAGASVVGVAMSPAQSSTAVTLTAQLTVQNAILAGTAGASGVGKACSSATTVGTPVWVRQMGGPVAASQISPPYIRDDVNGELILPPGTSIQLGYTTTAALGFGSITWMEYAVQ
jgi:hypothetical protein